MSTGLKTLISISTVVLLVLIVAYHMLEIQVRHYININNMYILIKILLIFAVIYD